MISEIEIISGRSLRKLVSRFLKPIAPVVGTSTHGRSRLDTGLRGEHEWRAVWGVSEVRSDRGRALMIRLKRQLFEADAERWQRWKISVKWPSRRISRRKAVNKGRTLKEKRCAHSDELWELSVPHRWPVKKIKWRRKRRLSSLFLCETLRKSA